MPLEFICLSVAISAFLFWFTGWKIGGIVVKCICAFHIVWSAGIATILYSPRLAESIISLFI